MGRIFLPSMHLKDISSRTIFNFQSTGNIQSKVTVIYVTFGDLIILSINTRGWFLGWWFTIIIVAFLFLNPNTNKVNKQIYETIIVIAFSLSAMKWSGGYWIPLQKGLEPLWRDVQHI